MVGVVQLLLFLFYKKIIPYGNMTMELHFGSNFYVFSSTPSHGNTQKEITTFYAVGISSKVNQHIINRIIITQISLQL